MGFRVRFLSRSFGIKMDGDIRTRISVLNALDQILRHIVRLLEIIFAADLDVEIKKNLLPDAPAAEIVKPDDRGIKIANDGFDFSF